MVRQYHPQRFRTLYEKAPYLCAHAAVHYLGFLFGEQTASNRFPAMWKGAPIDLYAFGDAQSVLNTRTDRGVVGLIAEKLDMADNPLFHYHERQEQVGKSKVWISMQLKNYAVKNSLYKKQLLTR